MQSADKALRILSLFDEHHAERGVSELSRLLGVHKSTTSRMLAAMEARGFVARSGERYRLGPEIVRLGGLALHGLGLTDACRPAMASLAESTGETVNLAVADGGAALNIDQIGAAHLVGVTDWTGRRLPLAKTANGKVLVAFGAAAIDVALARAGRADRPGPPGRLRHRGRGAGAGPGRRRGTGARRRRRLRRGDQRVRAAVPDRPGAGRRAGRPLPDRRPHGVASPGLPAQRGLIGDDGSPDPRRTR